MKTNVPIPVIEVKFPEELSHAECLINAATVLAGMARMRRDGVTAMVQADYPADMLVSGKKFVDHTTVDVRFRAMFEDWSFDRCLTYACPCDECVRQRGMMESPATED